MLNLNWPLLPSVASVSWGLFLAITLLVRRASNSFCRHVVFFLAAVSIVHLSDVMLVRDVSNAFFWRKLGFSGELLSVSTLLFSTLSCMDFREMEYRRTARWRAAGVFGIVLVMTALLWLGAFFLAAWNELGNGIVVLGPFGRVAYLFIVVVAVLNLSHLEQLLRQTPDPLRYRLKLLWIGLGGMMAYELFRASQYLLIPAFQFGDIIVHGSVSLVCLGLISWGLVRFGGETGADRVIVSGRALYGSLTVIVVGLYLIAVGGVAKWVEEAARIVDISIWSFALFLSAICFVVLSTSRVFWVVARQIKARFLHQPKYDYRAKWMEVLNAFSETTSVDSILDQLLVLLGRTFAAGRISIWLRFDADHKYHQIRTVNRIQVWKPIESSHHLVSRMQNEHEPIEVEAAEAASDHQASVSDPFLAATQAALIVPIEATGILLGFITLSRDPYSAQYGKDDLDLLRGVARHVGVLLAHSKLIENQLSATRFEALHEFSVFCLHDIKNLAQRLSLVVQNSKIHGTTPSFVDSAFKTIGGTVEKMNALMEKLAAKFEDGPTSSDVLIELDGLIEDVVRSLPYPNQIVKKGSVGKIILPISEDKLKHVVYNVLSNAQQADSGHSQVYLEAKVADRCLLLKVTDGGFGLSKESLRKLFVPFRSTKRTGFGVGLYQTKRLVESSGGSILIESEFGNGTTVRVELPISPENADYEAEQEREEKPGQLVCK
jgi:putative PEP-CTERM system histidine kinase